MLRNKSILLGVTGGVAAYKSLDLIRRLREEGSSVTVIMTGAAKNFVTPLSLEVASGNSVYADIFSDPMSHITLPANADILVIAPATANIIGKFANGIADDLLSTCLLSFRGKTVIAPAMNWRMYENPIFRKNLKTLLSLGVIQVGPEKGLLACGEEGIGKMADIPDIIESLKSALANKDLLNEKILVTAGPTREYLDPVRFLSNRSSGKMGYAIARAALRRGAEVTLISGPSSLDKPKGVHFISVETAGDMFNAVTSKLPSSTVLIMAAAVSDFTPAEMSQKKLEKSEKLILHLERSPDIIAAAGKIKKKLFIIGFAAETGQKTENAKKKLKEKNMDMIIFNDVTEAGSGFDVDTNKVMIIEGEKEISLPVLSKDAVADAILDRMVKIRA
ncbi:MAG: bifunctional phosphopantothenoylcysteine decarboxylase/phosphopantothenate--cysteine ligase CoaBC [Thermodesulfovibrionales bacterium]